MNVSQRHKKSYRISFKFYQAHFILYLNIEHLNNSTKTYFPLHFLKNYTFYFQVVI